MIDIKEDVPGEIDSLILLNGFQKKTEKTPKSEIEKALKLMKGYYEEKG
jgi:phage-related protein